MDNNSLHFNDQYSEVLQQLPAANAHHEDLNEQDKRSKRRLVDLIHSRRKRERKHQELTSIKDKARQLHHEQGILQNEDKRLEGLLKQAKHILREEHSRLEGLVAQAKMTYPPLCAIEATSRNTAWPGSHDEYFAGIIFGGAHMAFAVAEVVILLASDSCLIQFFAVNHQWKGTLS
jgi:hypothetical protein